MRLKEIKINKKLLKLRYIFKHKNKKAKQIKPSKRSLRHLYFNKN